MKRLTIEIPSEMFTKLKAYAALRNVSLRVLVTRMVASYVKEEEERG